MTRDAGAAGEPRSRLIVRLLDACVEVDGPAVVVDEVARLLGRAAAGAVPTRSLTVTGTRLHLDGEAPREAGPDGLLAEVLACLNATAVEQCVDFAVHAGVVARAGRAVAFPAWSGTGKSTLTAACLQAGLDYVSDEALVLHDDGGVRPYPKPLSLDAGSTALLGLPPPEGPERPVLAGELGARLAAGPLVLAHVVVLERRPGTAELTPLPRAEGAALLLRMSFNHFRDPVRALRAAAAPRAQAWALRYDRPADGAAAVVALLGP